MTRQYKQMQEELLKEISELNRTVVEKDEIISRAFSEIIENKEQYIADMVKDYDYRIKKKDDEISELKRKIDDMSQSFANMLKVLKC